MKNFALISSCVVLLILIVYLFIDTPSNTTPCRVAAEFLPTINQDAAEEITIEDGFSVCISVDHLNKTTIVFLKDNKVVHNEWFTNNSTSDVSWSANSTEEYGLIALHVVEPTIKKVEVMGLSNDDTHWIEYNDSRYVIGVSKSLSRNPVIIKGYSSQNELVYQNVKEE